MTTTIKKTKKMMGLMLSAASLLTLTHCSEPTMSTQATGDYNAADVGKVNKVVQGVIISERIVNVFNRGGVQDNPMASNTVGVDVDVTRRTGYEYVIKLDTGSIISVVQTENLHLAPKQRILVIYGASTRVVADEAAEG